MSDYRPPEARRVLVVAPHADDETIAAGGTIALYASMGAEVRLVVVSDGARVISGDAEGDIVRVRRDEALAAAEILGIGKTTFLGFPDGDLAGREDEIAASLRETVAEFDPEIIFSPTILDSQSDHMAVSRAVLSLFHESTGLKAAFYEVYGTIRPNILVDISGVADLKDRAVLSYRKSVLDCPEIFRDASEGVSRFWEFHTLQKGRYEAFWLASAPLSRSDVISWLTYDVVHDDPASLFLSKLKAVDELLHELAGCRDELEQRVRAGEASERAHAALAEEKAALEVQIREMRAGLAWRMAEGYYRMRDSLLPKGSGLRKLYDRFTERFKSGG